MRRLVPFVALVVLASACTGAGDREGRPVVPGDDPTATTVAPDGSTPPVYEPLPVAVGEIKVAGPATDRFGDGDVEAWRGLVEGLVRHGTVAAAITGHASPVLRSLFTPRAEAAAVADRMVLTDDGQRFRPPVRVRTLAIGSAFVFVGGDAGGADALAVVDVTMVAELGEGVERVRVQRIGSLELVRSAGAWHIDGWDLDVDRSVDLGMPLEDDR